MERSARNLVLVLAVSLGLLTGLARAQDAPVLPSDVLKLRTGGEIDVSADGRRAVFVVTSMFEDGDGSGYRHHLWLADLTGETPPRPLTHGPRADRAPVFSPDGSRIAFVRRDGEKAQIHVLPLDGGEAYPVTAAEHGARAPRWSPDGASILFTSPIPIDRVEGAPPWTPERPGRGWRDTGTVPAAPADGAGRDDPAPRADRDGDLSALRAWLAANAARDDPRIFDRLDVQAENDLADDLTFDHLLVVPVPPAAAAPGAARALTQGFQDFDGAVWTPDGTAVIAVSTVYGEHPDRVRDDDLWRLRTDGSGGEAMLDWRGWSVSDPAVSPDGTAVAFLAEDQNLPGFANRQLAFIGMTEGSPRRFVGNLDRDVVGGPVWSRDGEAVYVVVTDRGAFPLLRVSARDGAVERLVDSPLGVRDFDVGGGRLVYGQTSIEAPWALWARSTDGGEAARLIDLNEDWIAGKRLARPAVGWVDRPDGKRIQYWVMKPDVPPGTAVPTVLEIHGGPSAMWGPGEPTMWHEFQLLSSRGYGVVYANPRGSRGYGQDFRHANYRDWGHGPAGDLLAALDAAVAEHDWIDREQLVVTGGSYAGYMTAWIVSQDHRFRAAVAQRGVYDLAFFFGEGRAWRLVPDHFGGYPWEPDVRALLDANSPQHFVQRIRTPLLILHSDLDRRTGVNQSELLYKSLKVLGRPVEYVRYPAEGHDLSRSGNPLRRIDRLGRIVEFFERFVEHPAP